MTGDKQHPIIDVCCMTCRRADTSTIQFRFWCKKKKDTVPMTSYCENWNPQKDVVINKIYRFKKARGESEDDQ